MKNKKFLNTTIYGLTILLILILVFIGKTVFDINVINDSILQKRILLEKQYQQGLSLKDTTKQMNKIDEKLKSLSNIVIDSAKTLNFIKELEAIADENNLEQNINISEFSKPNIITPISISITLNGQYKNTLNYINDLDRKEFYINLNSITFSNSPSEISSESNVVTQLIGKIYVQ